MSGKSCCGGSSSTVKVKRVSCCTPADTSTAQCRCETADCMSDNVVLPPQKDTVSCSCGGHEEIDAQWITGTIKTSVGNVPQVSTTLSFSDTLGSWKCRWSIGRMDYKVKPGLYGVGTPDAASPVLVTANYKMTFDRLREQLSALNVWILVLDTDGVNVWCAAGKGTFGTDELVERIACVDLSHIVSHRTLILPQLGAVGISAHETAKRSGFRVVYGTVRAKDIKAFLAAGMVATQKMRTVEFKLSDRIVLTPMELVASIKPTLIILGVFFILNAIGLGDYGTVDLYALLGAIFVGCVIAPTLLPWIPGKAFAFKGALLGLLWAVGVNLINGFPGVPEYGWLKAAAYMLLLPALSAFSTMNFTGSSTYTSLSGVDKEMRLSIPPMLIAAISGVVLLQVNDFIKLLSR